MNTESDYSSENRHQAPGSADESQRAGTAAPVWPDRVVPPWSVPPGLIVETFRRIPGRDPVQTRLPRGIGLGLPIARRLVEAQGGRIWIEPPVSGQGTAIVMTLPLAVQTPLEDSAAPVAVQS